MNFSFLKEKDGKVSFTRLTGFILIIFYIIASAYSLVKNDKFLDIPMNFAIFIASLYGLNKLDVFKK